MPKAIKKKIVKKAATEIEVKGVLSRLKKAVSEKKGVFIGAAAAVIIFFSAGAGFLAYSNTARNNAEKLGYEAYKLYYGLYQKEPVVPKEEQYKKALEKFKKTYDTKKSPASLFYIASCYYELARYEDTLTTLKEMNRKFPDDERFIPLSYFKMAMASLKKGSNDEALNFLEILYKYKTGAYKDLSLIEAGKILETMGRHEEAKRKYEELTKDMPWSPFAEEAKARIGENKS